MRSLENIKKQTKEAEEAKPKPCVKCKGKLQYWVKVGTFHGAARYKSFPCDSCVVQ